MTSNKFWRFGAFGALADLKTGTKITLAFVVFGLLMPLVGGNIIYHRLKILLAEMDAAQALALIAAIRNLIIGIAVFVPVAATLIGLYFSRLISRPILKLRDACKELGRGNLDLCLEVQSNDEIGNLTASFNQMVVNLKKLTEAEKQAREAAAAAEKERVKILEQSRAEMEQKVAERTAELQKRLKELETFHDVAIGRELKMKEMQKELEELRKKVT